MTDEEELRETLNGLLAEVSEAHGRVSRLEGIDAEGLTRRITEACSGVLDLSASEAQGLRGMLLELKGGMETLSALLDEQRTRAGHPDGH